MMKKRNAPRDLPRVFVACETCSDMGHESNCCAPDEIAWIGGAWQCADCWGEYSGGDFFAFMNAATADDFISVEMIPAPDPEAAEFRHIARAVAALEG